MCAIPCKEHCDNPYTGETTNTWPNTEHRRANSSGLHSAVDLHLKEQTQSSEDSAVHIVDRGDRWLERGAKEANYVKVKKPSLNRGGLRHNLSPVYKIVHSSLPIKFSTSSKCQYQTQTTPQDTTSLDSHQNQTPLTPAACTRIVIYNDHHQHESWGCHPHGGWAITPNLVVTLKELGMPEPSNISFTRTEEATWIRGKTSSKTKMSI